MLYRSSVFGAEPVIQDCAAIAQQASQAFAAGNVALASQLAQQAASMGCNPTGSISPPPKPDCRAMGQQLAQAMASGNFTAVSTISGQMVGAGCLPAPPNMSSVPAPPAGGGCPAGTTGIPPLCFPTGGVTPPAGGKCPEGQIGFPPFCAPNPTGPGTPVGPVTPVPPPPPKPEPKPEPTNYTPWLLGAAAVLGLGAFVIASRKPKGSVTAKANRRRR